MLVPQVYNQSFVEKLAATTTYVDKLLSEGKKIMGEDVMDVPAHWNLPEAAGFPTGAFFVGSWLGQSGKINFKVSQMKKASEELQAEFWKLHERSRISQRARGEERRGGRRKRARSAEGPPAPAGCAAGGSALPPGDRQWNRTLQLPFAELFKRLHGGANPGAFFGRANTEHVRELAVQMGFDSDKGIKLVRKQLNALQKEGVEAIISAGPKPREWRVKGRGGRGRGGGRGRASAAPAADQ
ncbi:hypothetical protein T492DRAFT_91555 [Pavlovales sp. CCMP2436]|nr:hypothetical protein T492DRAFT_91555 [Pavlovales sp. CCMP2436]